MNKIPELINSKNLIDYFNLVQIEIAKINESEVLKQSSTLKEFIRSTPFIPKLGNEQIYFTSGVKDMIININSFLSDNDFTKLQNYCLDFEIDEINFSIDLYKNKNIIIAKLKDEDNNIRKIYSLNPLILYFSFCLHMKNILDEAENTSEKLN